MLADRREDVADVCVPGLEGSGLITRSSADDFARWVRPNLAAMGHLAHVRKLLAAKPPRLSRPLLETLAIIAYRQPIGRADIAEIRGVDVGAILKSLLERGLIEVAGRGEGLGRPMLYGTTPMFLEQFALRHLEELPRVDELAIALRREPQAL